MTPDQLRDLIREAAFQVRLHPGLETLRLAVQGAIPFNLSRGEVDDLAEAVLAALQDAGALVPAPAPTAPQGAPAGPFEELFPWAVPLPVADRLDMLRDFADAADNPADLAHHLHAWRITAQQLEDPDRAAILLDKPDPVPLPCLACGKALAPVFDREEQPEDAVVFTASGNYGSTVFDPAGMGRERLRVNICDECLKRGGRAGAVQLVQPRACQCWPTVTPWAHKEEEQENGD